MQKQQHPFISMNNNCTFPIYKKELVAHSHLYSAHKNANSMNLDQAFLSNNLRSNKTKRTHL
jgi:hypothetical protein